VNAGFSEDKLPVGLMIVGRHFEDGLVLRVAQCIEKLAAQP
jgi:amidase